MKVVFPDPESPVTWMTFTMHPSGKMSVGRDEPSRSEPEREGIIKSGKLKTGWRTLSGPFPGRLDCLIINHICTKKIEINHFY
jgi:hypothetical protein